MTITPKRLHPFESLHFLLTTHCNRACPHCCYRIPTHETLGKPQHYDWAYFEHAAQYLQGLKYFYVGGGEPCLHPEFPRVAREFRAMFKPEYMFLCTNGVGPYLERYADVLGCFDKVSVACEPGEPKPRQGMVWMQQHRPDLLNVAMAKHRRMDVYGGGGMCCRFWMAAYGNGRLYPCCIGPGLPGIATCAPSENWQEELGALPRPCHACAFSQPDPPGAE